MTIANLTVANNNGTIFITDNSFAKRTECVAEVMAIEKGIYTFIETANAAAQQDAAYSDAPIHGTFFSKEDAAKAAFNFVVNMIANIENDFAAGYPAPSEQPTIAIEKNAIVMRSANQYGQVAVCYEVEGGYTFICSEQDHANAAAGIYNNGFYSTKNGALNAALNFVEKMYNKVQSMFNAGYIAYEPEEAQIQIMQQAKTVRDAIKNCNCEDITFASYDSDYCITIRAMVGNNALKEAAQAVVAAGIKAWRYEKCTFDWKVRVYTF